MTFESAHAGRNTHLELCPLFATQLTCHIYIYRWMFGTVKYGTNIVELSHRIDISTSSRVIVDEETDDKQDLFIS